MNDLGKRLRQRRDQLGLKQKDIAARARVNPSTVSNWEDESGGLERPSQATIEQIAKVYEVTPEWICGAEVSRETSTAAVSPRFIAARDMVVSTLQSLTMELAAGHEKAWQTLDNGIALLRDFVQRPMAEVRYIADLAAGMAIPADRQPETRPVPPELVPRGAGSYEIYRAAGTSMTNVGIGPGAFVLAANLATSGGYHEGDIVVVQLEGPAGPEGTIKRYGGVKKGKRVFISESDDPADTIPPVPTAQCRIIGVVIARKEGELWDAVPRGA